MHTFIASLITGRKQFELVQVKKFEAELEEFHGTLDAMKKSLEEETHCKGNLQISIKSLKEELAYRREEHKEERQRCEKVRDVTFRRDITVCMWRCKDVLLKVVNLSLTQQAVVALQRKLTASIHSGGMDETDSHFKAGLIKMRERRQEMVKFYTEKVCKGVLAGP